MPAFADFGGFNAWLDRKGMFHMQLGLERMRRAIVRPRWPVIQVLGTNGKGSTSAFVAALAKAHGLTAGLYTSPHFASIRERVLVNGDPVPETIWLDAANELYEIDAATGFTWFEFMTLLAMRIFDRAKVDIAIFEAGLGGRNDATSAIPAAIRCFAPIAMDHAKVIGPGIADIAADKAAVISGGERIFSARQFQPVEAILKAACADAGAALAFAAPLPEWQGRLAGSIQSQNAAVALAAWRAFAESVGIFSDGELERHALETAFLPGRLQHIGATASHPELVLDGGHNPHAISNLLSELENRPRAIIFSALADKDWQTSLALLARTGAMLIMVQLENERAEQAEKLASFANSIRTGCAVSAASIGAALAMCQKGHVLICGSLYLLAAFYALYPQYLADAAN